ncbi:hypothetical protein ACFYT4_07385 [Streptomyces sp. NPDC004609]|uniref:hypothetical protein n=1 Tax=Streptomyces sp. NPDC004609 TaxID=3364704 RepID=UPI00367B2D0F
MARIRKRAAVLGSVLGLGLGVLAQGTAHAVSYTEYTSPSQYGRATMNTTTHMLEIWDTDTDSRRVTAWVWNHSRGSVMVAVGSDANGNNGMPGYGTGSWNYSAGDSLEIEVCRQNGVGGPLDMCAWSFFTA